MRIRVGIVDDHPAILLGTSAMLDAQSDMRVVATGGTVQDLLAWGQSPDVVLLDLTLQDGSTPRDNVRALAGLTVVVYTASTEPAAIRAALSAGAAGIVLKTELATTLCETIRAAARGETVASAEWAAALDGDSEFVTARLTDREAEVLALYASGETADRVAALLFLSRQTVYKHIGRIRQKYAAVDRAAPTKVDLFRRAVEDGFVPESD